MIGDLQAEALKHQAHGRVLDEISSESDSEHDSEYDSEDIPNHPPESANTERRSLSQKLVCPSCPRTKPFSTKQKLRRHHEQDTECREVCVCCHDVFRTVRKFKRHAEKCTSDSKRKRAYMEETCVDLTKLSDTKLDVALRKRKKRSRDEAGMAADPLDTSRSNPGAPKRTKTRQEPPNNIPSDPGENVLQSYIAPTTDIGTCLTRSTGVTVCLDPIGIQGQVSDLSTESAQENGSSLDALENFDAPLMHIMNSVPLDMYQWPMDGYDGNPPSNGPTMYRFS